MLFSAGIGIDLMFFSVAEPLSHYMNPPVGEGETFEAARQSMVRTLLSLRFNRLEYVRADWGRPRLFQVSLKFTAQPSYRHFSPICW